MWESDKVITTRIINMCHGQNMGWDMDHHWGFLRMAKSPTDNGVVKTKRRWINCSYIFRHNFKFFNPTTKNNIFGAKRHSFWSVKTQISDELSSLQPSVLLFILVDESGLPLWVTITTNRVETMSPQGTSLYGQITIDKQIQDGFPGRMTDFHGRFSTSFRYFIGGNIL
jgi:hypothetical protein